MSFVPYVIENTGNGERSYDIYSRLLKDRIVMVNGEIEPNMAGVVVSELLYLQSEDPERPIDIYISSPGGAVDAGLSICSTMKIITPPVRVTAHGLVASMGSVILSCGEKGCRFALPDTRIMLHQVSSYTDGNIQDMRIDAKETERLNDRLMEILGENTGHSADDIRSLTMRDYWMDANEAVGFGIVDRVLSR